MAPPASQKTVVITGVSRGLGLAMTQKFVDLGHRVAGCARSKTDIQSLQKKWGDTHLFAQVDVSEDLQVKQWAETVVEKLGPPDLLINNAALINRNAPLWEITNQEMTRIFQVNVLGTINVIRHFLPAMIARKSGVVVNFSSGWGRSVDGEVAPYCASKWAIEGLTRALALELPSGMSAVPLNPGIINTAMLQSCFGSSADSYDDPQEWADRAVPFLLNISSRDNGQPLTVPGG